MFFRANRNALVNLRMVKDVEPSSSDGYDLSPRDGGGTEVSRCQAQGLRSAWR